MASNRGRGLAGRVLAGALLGGLALLLVGCLPQVGTGLPSVPSEPLGITVEGEGRVEFKADRVEVRFALEAQGPAAEELTGQVYKARATLLETLSGLGMDPREVVDLQLSRWEGSLGPATPVPSPTPSQWRAFQTMSISVAPVSRGRELGVELLAAGVPSVQNITYLEDRVEARFALDASGGSAAEAQAEVSRKADSVQKALEAKGLKVLEMKITQAGLSPVPPQAGGASRPNYVARLIMSLSTGRLELVPQIAEAVAPMGKVEGLFFGISDPKPLLSRAREGALADAKKKAEEIASQTGAKLERVVNVVEVYGQMPPALGTPFVPPVPPGLMVGLTRLMPQATDVVVRVRVTYAIK